MCRTSPTAALVAALASAVLLVACSDPGGRGSTPAGSSSASSSVSPDTVLTMATSSLADAPSDPITGYPSYGEGERLLSPKPGQQLPWLAASVVMTDAKHWRITLRDGVKFQNGVAMTAKKVADWMANEFKNDYDPGVYQDAVIGVEGNGVVTVGFPTPRPGFGTDLAYFSLPVYDVDAVKSVGKDFSKLVGLGIYTGPYALTEVTATRWTYTRNPYYWAGKPALERIERVKVNDDQAGIRAVQNAEADVLDLVAPKLKPTIEAIKGLHFVTGDPALQPEFVSLRPNLGRAPWNDLVVRKALALTIDSADISAKASFGVYTTIKGIFPPGSPWGVDWMGADIPEANRLLDAAGWVRGADGVRAKAGVRLSGELVTSEATLNDVSVPLAETAKQAGFALTPKLGEAQTVYDQMTAGKFDIEVIFGQNLGYDGDQAAFCDMFDPQNSFAGTSSVKDPQIRAACDQLTTTRDTSVVEKVVRSVQERNAQQLDVIPVTAFIPASVTNDAWNNYRPNYFFDMISWQTKAN